MTETVADIPGHQLHETGRGIGDALDDAESGGGNSEHGQESRQDHRCGFVAKITQCAGETGAEDGAIEPAGGRSRFQVLEPDIVKSAGRPGDTDGVQPVEQRPVLFKEVEVSLKVHISSVDLRSLAKHRTSPPANGATWGKDFSTPYSEV